MISWMPACADMTSSKFRGRSNEQKVQVHVADSLETIGGRVVGAWRRAERGELTGDNAEIHIGFESWETMVRTLSPKRLELLRRLHRAPAKSIRALAQALGRDYRRVHEDVEALEAAGLLDRDENGLRADYDAFDVSMRVAL
jgi:predicted transcriptional regulator